MTAPVAWFCNPSQLQSLYLGQPGNMQKLPIPDAGYTAPISRGEVDHALASGGNTVTRRRYMKRAYGFAWSAALPEVGDLLTSFYGGAMGLGPYRLVDPSVRNHLDFDTANMGAALAANSSWSAPSGDTVPYTDPTQAAPSGIIGATPLHWPSPVSGHTLVAATYGPGTVYTPTLLTPVYLADQTVYVSIWMRAASGTPTVSLKLIGLPSVGTATPPSTSVSCPLTTTWTRYGFAAAPSASGFGNVTTPYITLGITAPASCPDLLLTAAQLEYGQTSKANPWVQGEGCPRVSIGGPFGSQVNVWWRRDRTLAMVEN